MLLLLVLLPVVYDPNDDGDDDDIFRSVISHVTEKLDSNRDPYMTPFMVLLALVKKGQDGRNKVWMDEITKGDDSENEVGNCKTFFIELLGSVVPTYKYPTRHIVSLVATNQTFFRHKVLLNFCSHKLDIFGAF